MTSQNSQTLERLAGAHPAPPHEIRAAVSLDERRRVLMEILSDDEAVSESTRSAPLRRAVVRSLAAAAAVAVVAFAVGLTREPSGGVPPVRRAVDPDAVVLDRIRLAVSEADTLILHVRTNYGTGVLWDAWFDDSTGRSRSMSSTLDGAPMYDHGFRPHQDGWVVRVVSHQDRAWWEYQSERFVSHGWSSDDIRGHLDAGTLEEVAREESGGRAELRLRWAPENAPSGARMQPGELWVDASTYLPVRSLAQDRGRTVTMEFEWLERSPSTEAFLEVNAPPGYPQLAGAPDYPADAPSQG